MKTAVIIPAARHISVVMRAGVPQEGTAMEGDDTIRVLVRIFSNYILVRENSYK